MVDIGLSAAKLARAGDMVRAVKAAGLPSRAAVIVIETGLVESTDLTIFANTHVPESLDLPFEAIGSDNRSVGVLQQQVPSWGTAADCMDPVKATLKFLNGAGNNPGLLNLPHHRFVNVGFPSATKWDQIPTGNAAQAVQVSAFPDRYAEQEERAQAIVAAFWDEEDDDMTPDDLLDALSSQRGQTLLGQAMLAALVTPNGQAALTSAVLNAVSSDRGQTLLGRVLANAPVLDSTTGHTFTLASLLLSDLHVDQGDVILNQQ